MLRETGKRMAVCGILVAIAAVGLIAWSPARAADPLPKPLKSGIVSFDEAQPIRPIGAKCGATSQAKQQVRRTC